MFKIKRITAILLYSVFFLLTGCNRSGNEVIIPPTATIAPTEEVAPTNTPTPMPTATPEPTNTPTPMPTATPEPTSTPTPMPTATPEPTNTPTPMPTATPEPTNTPTPMPTATPKPTSTPKPTPTTVPEKKDTRFEDGMAKVMKLIDAYDDLIKKGGACERFIQTDLELLTDYAFKNMKLKTSDGKDIAGHTIYDVAGSMYYYNYVNKNTGFYKIDEWIENQKSSSYIYDLTLKGVPNGSTIDTNDVLMYEAPALIMWFKQSDSIEGYDFTETDKYVISGIKSSYVIKLNVDGDKTCTAVFDKDDNLLNICTSASFNYDNFIPSNLLD